MKIAKKKMRRGAAAVEVAVVLPILLMVTFGAIKYGWLFYRLHQITNVARQAARVAIRPSVSFVDLDKDGVADTPQAVIAALMKNAGMEDMYTPSVSLSGTVGGPVTVTITVPTNQVDIVKMSTFLPAPDNLSASVTMSKEGPL